MSDLLNHQQFSTVMHPVSDLLPLADPGANDDYVPTYAEDMRSGKWKGEHPEEPVNVHTWNDAGRALVDGSHRVLAAHQAGLTHLPTLFEHHDVATPEFWKREYAHRKPSELK